MRIAIVGYGKMGQAIERIAAQRGHEVVLRITSQNKHALDTIPATGAEVAIEFSMPESAFENVTACLSAGVPVVCGTTGWNVQLQAAESLAHSGSAALIHASNFSVGVNIFFELNRRLAALMQARPEYNVAIEEVHHLQKKDKPSGTAITVAEGILAESPGLHSWQLAESARHSGEVIPVTTIREADIPGTHTVSWASQVDQIDIRHTARSRDGFALGAVLAAEFIVGKRGVFSMRDVLDF